MKSCVERHLDLACTRLQKQEQTIEEQQRKVVEQETKMTEQGRVLEEALKTIRRFEGFESETTHIVYEGKLVGIKVLMVGLPVSASFYLKGYKMALTSKREVTSVSLGKSTNSAILIGINVIVGKYDHLVKWPFRSKVLISFPDAKGRNQGVFLEVCIASPSEDNGLRLVKSGYMIHDLSRCESVRFVAKLVGVE